MPSVYLQQALGANPVPKKRGSIYLQQALGGGYSAPSPSPWQPEQDEQDRIFSGNIVMDLADALSVGQYGLAGGVKGALEGKGIWEGVKEGVVHRASWREILRDHTDLENKSVTAFGLKLDAANALGTALDLIADPLNYIPVGKIAGAIGKGINKGADAVGVTKALRSLPVPDLVTKLADAASDLPISGRTLGEVLDRMAEDKKLLERFVKLDDARIIETSKQMEGALDFVRESRPLPKTVRQLMFKYIAEPETAKRAEILGELVRHKVNPEQFTALAERGADVFQKLGDELEALGALSKETRAKYGRNYIPRLFEKFEDPAGFVKRVAKTDPERAAALTAKLDAAGFGGGKGFKVAEADMGFLNPRQELPQEVLKDLGLIEDAPTAVLRGSATEGTYISKVKFLHRVSADFAKDFADDAAAAAAGYVKVADTTGWGPLKGKYLPEVVTRQLNEMAAKPSEADKVVRGLIGTWKAAKTIWNPATHARNVLTNFLLTDFGTGLTPGSPSWWKYITQAAREMTTHGELYKEAKQAGTFLTDTFVARELPALLKESVGDLNPSKLTALFGWLKSTGKKMGDLYQAEEELGKLTLYLSERDKLIKGGMATAEAATKAAQSADDWLFNYRRVPKWIRLLRDGQTPLGILGTVPFATFQYKAIGAMGKTLLSHPERVTKYFKLGRGVEALSDEQETAAERRVLPEWMKSGAWLKLPAKDSYGRSLYFDATNILPLADLAGANIVGPGQVPAMASTPFIDLWQDIVRNQSRFTGRPIWGAGMDKKDVAIQIGEYLGNQLLPSLFPGGSGFQKIADAAIKRPDWLGRTQSLRSVVAATVLGLKTRAIDQGEEMAFRSQEYEDELQAIERRLSNVLAHPRYSEDQKQDAWDTAMAQMNYVLDQLNSLYKP